MKKERFNFNKDVKMHLACASDELRPVMECIYFKDGFAYASDGHILVKNRISECSTLDEETIKGLDGKLLHKDFYKDILKYDNILIAEDGIECTKGNDRAFFYFGDQDAMKYPDAEKLVQNYMNASPHQTSQISFNMNLFKRINGSLYNCDQCTTNFKGDGSVMVIFSYHDDVSSIGIIMPIGPSDQ